MDAFLHKFQHLRIQLEDITKATNNFDDKNRIGVGGFGKVYEGEVCHNEGRSKVAIKRLDHTQGQGTPEFLKEITMLSDYTLTKESDVYSFGVVLFKVLCGRLCYTHMAEVVTQLETALEVHEFIELNPLFDYQEMIKSAEPPLNYSSKGELMKLLYKGVLLNHGKTWFSLDQNGKKCVMLSVRVAFIEDETCPLCLPESRFGEAFQCDSWGFVIDGKIQYQLLSSKTRYASYLVYQLPEDKSGFEAPMKVEKIKVGYENNFSSLPRQRKDGWMEVEITEFQTEYADQS
ncbi:hypothetical protein L1987_65460 [Smallanthus sonchifolius]|uniref:Uncharacterized protein n=1 Tax=Smallanthus sonchifolius TaxID=185202 RepID=A0ACB9BUF8_9ASTR|nr:hypothetical protein L1987_65460 [Smallanthus sonchifolius]